MKLRNSKSILPYCDERYKPPTPEEVEEIITANKLSQRDVALITGVTYSEKGSPTVRRWKAPTNSDQHREIPYAAWRLLVEYTGLSSNKETKSCMNKG